MTYTTTATEESDTGNILIDGSNAMCALHERSLTEICTMTWHVAPVLRHCPLEKIVLEMPGISGVDIMDMDPGRYAELVEAAGLTDRPLAAKS